jgi:Rhodanese-like domain
VRTDRRSIFPILMVLFGALLMIGALLWLILATRQSVTRAAILPSQGVSQVTPVASLVTPVATPAIPYPEIKRISLGDAKAAFELKSAVFIDVRGEPYYSDAHIPGAISMTYDEMSSRMGELDKKAWIITYCT